jgi:hypothetical protein
MNNIFSGDGYLGLPQFLDKARQNGIQISINRSFGTMLSQLGIDL